MLVQTEMKAKQVEVECPHCNKDTTGYCGDPRGQVVECEFCGKEFQIHNDADIEMY